MKEPNLVIAIQPEKEPLASLVKIIAEYGMDEVTEAMAIVELYIMSLMTKQNNQLA